MELTDNLLDQLIRASGFNNDAQLHAFAVIRCIAINPATPVHVLDALANHSHIDVLERLGGNPSTPTNVLAELAMNPHPSVRAEVADNPKTPEKVLWTLARDESADVRYQLAENHNLPERILQFLAHDENAYVASRAYNTLARLASKGVVGRISEWFSNDRQALNG